MARASHLGLFRLMGYGRSTVPLFSRNENAQGACEINVVGGQLAIEACVPLSWIANFRATATEMA